MPTTWGLKAYGNMVVLKVMSRTLEIIKTETVCLFVRLSSFSMFSP